MTVLTGTGISTDRRGCPRSHDLEGGVSATQQQEAEHEVGLGQRTRVEVRRQRHRRFGVVHGCLEVAPSGRMNGPDHVHEGTVGRW